MLEEKDYLERFRKQNEDYDSEFEFTSISMKDKIIIYKHLVCGTILEKSFINFRSRFGCNNKDCVVKRRNKIVLEKYGVTNAFQSEEIKNKIKKVNLEKYGVENPAQSEQIKEKTKETCREKYGVDYSLQNKELIEKRKKTCLEKYGVDNPSKSEIIKAKIVQTNLERYGVEYSTQNKKVQKKRENNNLEKYGVKYPLSLPEVIEKREQTNLEKYGCKNVFQNEEIKNKSKDTIIEKYGVENISQNEDIKTKKEDTCELNYGVKYFFQDKENLNKFKQTMQEKYGKDSAFELEEFKIKAYETKKKNNSFNISSSEDCLYNILIKNFTEVKRQYRDDNRYPYACDFYLPEYDLFIEYQGNWTHGNEIYNPKNEEHQNILKKYTHKLEEINFKGNKKSFYEKAIYVWSVLDPLKRKIAKDNNLNYLEIFNFENENDVVSQVKRVI